jgi:hypothetical protein
MFVLKVMPILAPTSKTRRKVSFIQFGSRPPLYHARLMNVFPSPKVKGLAGTLTRKEVAVARPSSKAEKPINRNHEDCTHGRVTSAMF